jgi:hypothetical protein
MVKPRTCLELIVQGGLSEFLRIACPLMSPYRVYLNTDFKYLCLTVGYVFINRLVGLLSIDMWTRPLLKPYSGQVKTTVRRAKHRGRTLSLWRFHWALVMWFPSNTDQITFMLNS